MEREKETGKTPVEGLRESVNAFKSEVKGVQAKTVMDLMIVTQYFDMMKDVGSLKGAMKESPAKMSAAYASASASMNVWLEGVDLPLVGSGAYDPRSLPVCDNPATGPCLRE